MTYITGRHLEPGETARPWATPRFMGIPTGFKRVFVYAGVP